MAPGAKSSSSKNLSGRKKSEPAKISNAQDQQAVDSCAVEQDRFVSSSKNLPKFQVEGQDEEAKQNPNDLQVASLKKRSDR